MPRAANTIRTSCGPSYTNRPFVLLEQLQDVFFAVLSQELRLGLDGLEFFLGSLALVERTDAVDVLYVSRQYVVICLLRAKGHRTFEFRVKALKYHSLREEKNEAEVGDSIASL